MDRIRKYCGRPIECTGHKYPEKSDETFLIFPGGSVMCFICKEYLPHVPKDKIDVTKKEHKKSGNHLRIHSVVKRNGIFFDWSSTKWHLFCRICNKTLGYNERILDHVMTFDHKLWFEEMEKLIISESLLVSTSNISIEDFLRSESDFARCRVCDLNIECTLKDVSLHTLTASHRKLLLQALKPCTGLFPIENEKAMWCKVCDLRLDNKVEEVLQHLTSNHDHGLWFYDVDNMSRQDISITDFLRDEKEMRATCCRCDLKIKCDPRSIQAHVHSETHRQTHRSSSELPVKSLAEQDIWPPWCYWNFFGHPALGNRVWPA